MTYYAFSALVNTTVSTLLGLFVIYKDPKAKINKNLLFWCATVAFWSFFYFIWQLETAEHIALVWVKLLMLGAIWVPVAYFKVVVIFLELEKAKKKIIIINYILALFFSLLLATPLMVAGLEPVEDFVFWPKPGFAFHFFLIWFVFMSIYSAYISFNALKEKKISSIKKLQLKYIIFGIAISIAGGSTNYFLWYDIPIKPFGNILASVYVITAVYAMIRYRFMGIKVITSNLFIYFVLYLFIISVYSYAVWTQELIFGTVWDIGSFAIGSLVTVVFIFLFLKILKKTEELSDIIFHNNSNPKKIKKDLMIKLSRTINIQQILDITEKEFKKILKTRDVDVVIFDPRSINNKKCLAVLGKLKKGRKSNDLSKLERLLCSKLTQNNKLIIRDEIIKNIDLIKQLDKHGIKIISPFVLNDKPLGFVILGENNNKDLYSIEEIEFLELICPQIAIIIENALLHKETKNQAKELANFNKKLKQQVIEKTKKITDQNRQLKKLLVIKSQFIDIVSHQLRTPVGVIKSVLNMIRDKKIKNKEALMDGVFVKSMKISEVIDEIVYAFNVEAESFNVNQKAIDIVSVVEKGIQNPKRIAKESTIKFNLNLPKEKLLPVFASQYHLEKVVSILTNNAVVYNKKNGLVEVKIEQNKVHTTITVSDSGKGISEEYVKNIFKPFIRGKDADDFDTDKSGLGLYLAKKIIDAHIDAEIKLVKTGPSGTTFKITLPTLTKDYMIRG